MDELAEFVVYCCAEWKNKEATVAGTLLPVNVYNEQWGGAATAASAFQNQGSEERHQEGACRGREPGTNKEAADVGDNQSGGGEHR